MKRFLWVFLFLSFLGVSFWVLFFSLFTQIKQVEILGEAQEKERVREIIQDFLKEKRGKIFSQGNFFLFPEKKLERKLREQFPLLEKIETEKKFPEKLTLKITERKNVFIWCFDQNCFWVDGEGELFFGPQAFFEAEKTGYPVVLGQADDQRKIGENFFSPNLAIFLLDLKNILREEFSLERLVSVSPNLASEEIRVSFKEGWQVYFSLKKPALQQVEILREILEEKLKEVVWEKIDYIDLRLSGKAVFKLKNEPSGQSSEESREGSSE